MRMVRCGAMRCVRDSITGREGTCDQVSVSLSPRSIDAPYPPRPHRQSTPSLMHAFMHVVSRVSEPASERYAAYLRQKGRENSCSKPAAGSLTQTDRQTDRQRHSLRHTDGEWGRGGAAFAATLRQGESTRADRQGRQAGTGRWREGLTTVGRVVLIGYDVCMVIKSRTDSR